MTDFFPLPRLIVLLAPRERPIELCELNVRAEVSGGLAVTTWELVFLNPNGRPLEGQLEFPLLDGQSVIRFAMDMGSALREAVPVAKDKGRQVFEEIVRRGVDPGLLERTAGNNYKARVYPLLPGQRKRVVIAYQEALEAATYRLALAFDAPIPRFTLEVAVRGQPSAPVVRRDTLGLSLPTWRSDQVTSVEKTGFKARGVLELELPAGERPAVTTEERGDRVYFRAEQVVAPRSRPRPIPRVIGLLWDCSGSADARDLKKEHAALDAYFKALGGPVEVRLVRLRDVAEAPETFKVAAGEWSALKRAIDRTLYDGATSLAGVDPDPEVDAWILVSDGLLNYGAADDDGRALARGRAPIHVLVAAAKSDPARLRALADRSGGAHVDLLQASSESAAWSLLHEDERLLALDTSPREVAHVFPEAPAPVRGGRLIFAGVLRGESASLRARLGFPGDPASEREVEVEVRGDGPHGRLAARAWAAAKIAALEPDYARNQADLEKTGQEFGIVTRGTSLIILDELADYVRHDITPPEDLRPAWERARRGAWELRERSQQERIQRLARMFGEYVAWYDRIFDRDPVKAPITPGQPPQGATRGRGGDEPVVVGSVYASAPPRQEEGGADGFGGVEEDADYASSVDEESYGDPGPAPERAQEVAAPAPEPMASSEVPVAAPPPPGAPPLARPAAPAAARPAPRPAASPRMDMMEMEPERERGVGGPQDSAKGRSQGGEGPSIQLQKWSPDAPYLDRLRRAANERLYHVYLEERPDYARSTAFFLDVADVFFDRKMPALALRILSNLAEMELENPAILRILGYRLLQADRPDLARPIFEQVRRLRPEEPQSHRDLAHACAALGDLEAAALLLWEVAIGQWDARFPEIELLALVELNAILATAHTSIDVAKFQPALHPNLRRAMPLELRVVLTWDADNTDIDLWVTDPNGERAYYGNRLTRQGGRMSPDFRQGYGPEEFSLRRAAPGEYLVQANFYGNTQQIIAGATTIQLQFITGFATREARDQRITLRLRDTREVVTVGTFTVGR